MQQRKQLKMSKRSSLVAQRAWDLLHALIYARKGEFCRNKVEITINIFHRLIRRLIHSTNESRRGALLYGDHEFSFGNTPVVHVRMHRPKTTLPFSLPCIKPRVDDCDDGGCFDDDEDDGAIWSGHVHRACFLKDEEEEGDMSDESDEGIDRKAEEFIAKFYEEIKQQTQISYL